MADSGVPYTRPVEGFRFRFGGLKTNSVADSLQPDKYAYAANIRALRDSSVRTRWGLTSLFPTSANAIIDIRAYAALFTDNLPRFLAYRANGLVYLGQPGNLSTAVGVLVAAGSSGASMIPFRPAQSPNPWMYVANGADYQKLSAPAPTTDAVTQQNVGIAEPPAAPDAASNAAFLFTFSSNPSYAHAGVAGAVSNTARITDTVQSVFADPSSPAIGAAFPTYGVSASQVYTRQMVVSIGGTNTMVTDVFPGQAVPIGISAIFYFSGATGHCIVVPQNMGAGPGNEGESIYTQNLLSTIRRGALVQFSGGAEICIVWSVTEGPNGTISFETSTTGTHTTAETFTAPPAIQTRDSGFTVGQAITSPTATLALSGAGIGTETSTGGLGNPFVSGTFSFQPDDYIQFPILLGSLAALNEVKLLFDVGDGSFTQNFYYYAVRPSDIEAGIQNTLTQLGAAQLVTQRATIDEEKAAASNNQQQTASSAQTTPGDTQWAEIVFPISALTRVGNDQTKTLQNVNAFQVLFNMNAASGAIIGTISVFGGFAPDVGPNGSPYLYRVRPRSSVTGAKGNPSPETRYGVSPRRTQVTVSLPSAAYDSQIDTWDVFRYGGSVTSWRKIGQALSSFSTGGRFADNFSDAAALAGEELELDNLQPWPTIDLPLNSIATTVCGTAAVITGPSSPANANILRYLPGNLIRFGGVNVYTLQTRPIYLGGTSYLFQLIENAGALTNALALIYEPTMAQQRLPYMWGPDAAGTVFGVGDPLRPGTVSFAKNYAPDSAPDAYNIEITQPAEPLLGGEILDGLSFIASTERWWAMYPQPSNLAQRYSVIQQPIPRGLAAPFGHCNDGKAIYWWAKDGIWASDKGSLTDADLSNVFPHDGVPGVNYTYNGQTVFAPDYSRAGGFRLERAADYLYATYQDSTGTYRCLVLDLKKMAWSVDIYGRTPTVFYHPDQQEGTILTESATYPTLVVGCTNGTVYTQSDNTNDDGIPIPCAIATMEWDGGDLRAGEQWGDMWVDCVPNALGAALTVTPMAFGSPAATPTVIPAATKRVQTPVSVGGELLSDFLGMQLAWTDDYSRQTAATSLQIWQPSFIHKPELIADRYTDWYDGGTESAKYVQGFLLHADTLNQVKGLQVRDGDALAIHPFTTPVQHNGESIRAYSFNVPFIAHTMRLEPTDAAPWRFFDVDWVFEETPEFAETWKTQGTSFGLNGYSHIQRIVAAYAATQPVTLTITSFDGTSPQPIVLPATGSAYQKALRVCTFNKGQLFTFAASSSAPFQLYLEDFEILVGGWGRPSAYITYKSLGGNRGDQAKI